MQKCFKFWSLKWHKSFDSTFMKHFYISRALSKHQLTSGKRRSKLNLGLSFETESFPQRKEKTTKNHFQSL
jgi:hypothetical protein